MNRRVQLALIALVVTAIATVVSHSVVRWLGVRTSSVSHRVAGAAWQKPMAYVAGSSLLGDALNVDEACSVLEQGMQTWFVAGGSPSEWEQFQARAPEARLTIMGISAYDLNEHVFCDVQANIVPFSHAVRNLIQSRSEWAFTKRVLSQYPLKYVRILFPTVGRSQGVMGGLREHLERIIRPGVKPESEAGPLVPTWGGAVSDIATTEKITDWSKGYLLRSLAKLRSACEGRHAFDGPKRLAFRRMLEQAHQQGRVVVLVLPVSPAYQQEFFDAQTSPQFETALAEVQRSVPGVLWVRLDQLAELNSNDVFRDVVHMNATGKAIATAAFLQRMQEAGAKP